MKKAKTKTAAYCPPKCRVLQPAFTAGFLQGSNFVQSGDMETYTDQGSENDFWN